MGDPSVTSTSWMCSAKTSEAPHREDASPSKRLTDLPEISGARFVAYIERWDLLELSEESLHDWEYEKLTRHFDRRAS